MEPARPAWTRGRTEHLRVAIEVRCLDRGGLEAVVASLARGLPSHGIDPVVVCVESGGEMARALAAEGIDVEVLTSADRVQELRTLLIKRGIGLLSAHFSTLGAPIAHELGIPTVASVHNVYAWIGQGILDEVRALDPLITRYVAVSDSVAGYTRDRFKIAAERLVTIRNGVRSTGPAGNEDLRARARSSLGVPQDAEFVVQIARVEPLKCQLAFLEAIAQLAPVRPRLVAWLVGPAGDEDYDARVRDRIVTLGLEERVSCVGARDDVATILSAADLYVQASFVEGLSVASVEALLAGVPAVLTDVGDADFLLEIRGPGAAAAGALVAVEKTDPVTAGWEELRAMASADAPGHVAALGRAITDVLDDLPARRDGARRRAAGLAKQVSEERMCEAYAALFWHVAALAVGARSQHLASLLRGMEDARDEAHAALAKAREELREAHGFGQRFEEMLGDIRSELATMAREAAQTHQRVNQNLGLTQRTLDKLRLRHRITTALQQWKQRWMGTAAPPRAPLVDRALGTPGSPRNTHWLVLGVVPLDDSGGAQRCAQIARALAREGARVTYVGRFPKSESRELPARVEPEGLEVLAWDRAALRAWLSGRDERITVLVETPEPETIALVREARAVGARVLYDKVDHWEECPWAPWFTPAYEEELVSLSDDVVASARLLAEGLERTGREVHLLPNAYDPAMFGPEAAGELPADLATGEVTLVYAGALWGEWFDWDLVREVGRRFPDWAINLIGDEPAERPPGVPPNVHFLGLKPQGALPAYYAAATACLIPFVESALVDAVSPLKVYEYLAMGRLVVATPMRELAALPGVVTVRSAADIASAIEGERTKPIDRAGVDDFLRDHTWQARARALRALTAEPTVSIVVLCFNNEDVIGRCVDSLVEAGSAGCQEIIVVDNGSTDGSIALLEERAASGKITLLRNDTNGCSSGRNLGVGAARGEMLVFLDSDQWVTEENWLAPAVDLIARDGSVGAVAWNAGWFRPGSAGGTIVDDLPHRGMTGPFVGETYRFDVAYLATSGWVMPRAVWAKIDGFDEAYDPTCFEDTDLSFQVKRAGYRLAYCPSLGVDHRPHATTGALREYDALYARNERYFLDKWSAHPDYFFDVPEDA